MELEQIFLCLIVCLAKVSEISIQSLKTVCMVKNQKIVATCLAFLECTIWGLVISSIIDTLSENIVLLLFYCLGYALGLLLGSTLENKIALGTSNVQLMVDSNYILKVEEYLRENGHGFTSLKGHGSKDEMYLVIMVIPRKQSKKIIKEINNLCDNKVFVITSDVNNFVGGYGIKK